MAIRRITVSCALVLLLSLLSACSSSRSPFVIDMELTSDYADTDPFVIEQLFSVSADAESVDFKGDLQMKSETCTLQIADNETDEPLIELFWRESFNESGEDREDITLYDLVKDKEYVVRLTCTEVENVKFVLTSDSNLVKTRA